jgi:hypothetical protein
VVIGVIGTVTGLGLSTGGSVIDSSRRVNTINKLNAIEVALETFRLANNRLPCPGDGQMTETSDPTHFGYEAANLGSCTGGTPAANFSAANAQNSNIPGGTSIVEGAVPVRTLNLPDEFQVDGWGRRFAYAVWAPMTSANTFQTYGVNLNCGGISIKNAGGGNRTTSGLYALISYGPDGHGAYPVTGGTTRINAGSSDANQLTNCHCSSSGSDTTYSANYVLKDQTATFDDIVRFRERFQLMSTADKYQTTGTAAACGSGTCTLPWGGTMAQGAAAINAWPSASVTSPATCAPAGTHTVTCPTAPTTLCDGSSTLTNCQASSCVVNCAITWTDTGTTDTVNNGSSVTAYQAATAADCTTIQQTRTCTSGTLSGTYTYKNCSNAASCTPTANAGGGTMTSGGTRTEYQSSSDATCTAETMTCTNGTLSCSVGNMASDCQYNSCLKTCAPSVNQGGGTLASGATRTEYQASSGATCTAETMTCTNGTLSCSVGNMSTDCLYSSCTPTNCTPSANEGGGTMATGTTRPEYATNSGTCTAETMTCTNGTLSCSTGNMSTDCLYSSCTSSCGGCYGTYGTAGDNAGSTVAMGDVNGDGYADLIIGAAAASPGGNGSAGSVYVVFGGPAGLPDPLDLSSLNGTNGFRLDGAAAGNGIAGLAAGDVNGDGKADIIIGSIHTTISGHTNTGSVYVVFGGATGAANSTGTAWTSCPCTLNAAFLNGTNGAEFDGTAGGNLTGGTVAVGDVNGDGKADIIIGATGAKVGTNSSAGAVYLVFGKAAGWSGTATVLNSTFLNGTNGAEFDGVGSFYEAGYALAVGDVNGDGKGDIIIGSPYAKVGTNSTAGSVYVVFGKAAGWSGTATLLNSTFLNGTNGVEFDGIAASNYTGYSVAAGNIKGSVNGGNKISDIVIGAPQTTISGNTHTGSVYVVFGKAAGWSGTATLLNAAFLNGTNGAQFNGPALGTLVGQYGLTVGDVNGDGYADILVGAVCQGQNSCSDGQVYAVLGKAAGWSGTATVLNSTFLNGTNGFILTDTNPNDLQPTSMTASGDINKDNKNDIAVGYTNGSVAGRTNSGAVYFTLGRSSWPASLNQQ